MQEIPRNDIWVILHVPDDLWWRPDGKGYTKDLVAAGVYSKEEAQRRAKGRPSEDKAMSLDYVLQGLQEKTVLISLLRHARHQMEPAPGIHLQKNGYQYSAACGMENTVRTWNLCHVTCEHCKESKQFTDSEYFGDPGSEGREIDENY